VPAIADNVGLLMYTRFRRSWERVTEVKSSEFEAGVKRRLSLIRLARGNRTSLALNAISIAFPQISHLWPGYTGI